MLLRVDDGLDDILRANMVPDRLRSRDDELVMLQDLVDANLWLGSNAYLVANQVAD